MLCLNHTCNGRLGRGSSLPPLTTFLFLFSSFRRAQVRTGVAAMENETGEAGEQGLKKVNCVVAVHTFCGYS